MNPAALPRSRADAVTISALALRYDLPRRTVEAQLQEWADSGEYPICASTSHPMGVWLGTPADVRVYLAALERRLRSQHRRRNGLRRWLRVHEGQMELWAA